MLKAYVTFRNKVSF